MNGNIDINKSLLSTQATEELDSLEKKNYGKRKKENELTEECISY